MAKSISVVELSVDEIKALVLEKAKDHLPSRNNVSSNKVEFMYEAKDPHSLQVLVGARVEYHHVGKPGA